MTDGSIRFFTEECALSVVRDRRAEGGTTAWLGPAPASGQDPEFVLVAFQGEVKEPLDPFGFRCESREAVTAVAERARDNGSLVEGPIDHGGSVGYFVVVREPSGHLVEFTHVNRCEVYLHRPESAICCHSVAPHDWPIADVGQ